MASACGVIHSGLTRVKTLTQGILNLSEYATKHHKHKWRRGARVGNNRRSVDNIQKLSHSHANSQHKGREEEVNFPKRLTILKAPERRGSKGCAANNR